MASSRSFLARRFPTGYPQRVRKHFRWRVEIPLNARRGVSIVLETSGVVLPTRLTNPSVAQVGMGMRFGILPHHLRRVPMKRSACPVFDAMGTTLTVYGFHAMIAMPGMGFAFYLNYLNAMVILRPALGVTDAAKSLTSDGVPKSLQQRKML